MTAPSSRLPIGETEVLMRRATGASVLVALTLIAAKAVAWWLTDSVAILSTLADSFLDALASLVTFFAVRQAVQPADREHRFGHGKAEALAALGQAAFITGSGMLLLFEAGKRFFEPAEIGYEFVGIGVMGFSIVLTLALVLYQRSVVRHTNSLAIGGDSLHYQGDLLINLSVAGSLAADAFLDIKILDPIFAMGIVLYLLWNAWQIAKRALGDLMDRELPEDDRERIREIVHAHPEVRSMHDLRSRRSGLDTFIQLHLELDPQMRLTEAHEISDQVEAEIIAAFPGAEVIIHQDPEGLEEDHPAIAHQTD
jgi:ferrous-iron efflux pump FieF